MTEKSPKTAVLLINLGSPDEPTASALKPYLREFLSDRRVVDLNPIFWQTLLNLVILPRRSPKSAARYAQVWMKEGAPLKVYTDRIADKLRQRLQEKAVDADVFVGMRYGNPSQVEVFKAIHNEHGFDRVLVLPLLSAVFLLDDGLCFRRRLESYAADEEPPEGALHPRLSHASPVH